MLVLDSMAFINGAKNKTYYLLAVLNSTLTNFWIKKNVPEYGDTGYRLSNQFVTKIPIPLNPQETILNKLNSLVEEFLLSDKIDSSMIDNLIFQIYQLTPEEIIYIKQKKYLD